MKKLFMAIPLLGYSLTYPDFSLCYKKYKNYSVIPISRHYSISSKRPKHYVKYDEKYKIYLIKTYNKNYFHFKNSKLASWLASIKNGAIYVGNYAEYPKKNIPAKFSTKTTPGSIISDTFCNPIGVGVNGGFLTATYVRKFIFSKRYNSSKNRYSNVFKFLGVIVDTHLNVKKILPNSWAERHYIPTEATKIIKINDKKVNSLKDISSIPKTLTITFDINGTIWNGNYKGK